MITHFVRMFLLVHDDGDMNRERKAQEHDDLSLTTTKLMNVSPNR